MVIKSDHGIYKILEQHLRKTASPLTCVDLFDRPDVRRLAQDANKVSDYLGHMWRRGLLQRFTAPKGSTSFARFGYTWREEADKEDVVVAIPARSKRKPQVVVSEHDGSVTVDFAEFTLTIKPKEK